MADPLDSQVATGMTAEGEDWSYKKNSERKDRPLEPVQLKALLSKSDTKGFMQLGSQLGFIAALQAAIAWSPVWWLSLALMPLLGFSIVTFSHCAQHESIHNTAFATKQFNVIVSWLASLPRFTNPTHERFLHKQHHSYTNDPDRDPELWSGNPRNKVPDSVKSYLFTLLRLGGGPLGLGVYASRAGILWNCARGRPVGYGGFDLIPDAKARLVRKPLIRSAQRQLFFYAAFVVLSTYLGIWPTLVKLWLLPMAMGEPFHAFFHIGDHVNCAHDHKDGRVNTRTTKAPRFVSWNLWNMNYHAEHHLYPSIPFHQLPQAHEMMAKSGHFENVSNSGGDLHRNILGRWIPYLVQRLKEGGVAAVETDWQPYKEKKQQ